MSTHRRRLLALASLVLLALTACDEGSTGPDTRTDAEMNFLRAAPTAPPLAQTSVSFYAVRGESREASIYYRPAAGATDSSEFLTLKVPGAALLARPDGSPIADGDAVLITIRVLDPSRFIAEFQPAGLRFSSAAPAKLEMYFAEAEDDLDGDGDEDGDDLALTRRLAVWRQEAVGQPWRKLYSVLFEGTEEVEANLGGFSNYAISY